MTCHRKDANVYLFDLHGSLIFDSYDAVSCVPVRGLVSPFQIMRKESSFFTDARRETNSCQTLLNNLLWNEALDNSTSPSFLSSKEMVLCSNPVMCDSTTLDSVVVKPPVWIVPLKLDSAFLKLVFLFADQEKEIDSDVQEKKSFVTLAKQLYRLKMKRFQFLRSTKQSSVNDDTKESMYQESWEKLDTTEKGDWSRDSTKGVRGSNEGETCTLKKSCKPKGSTSKSSFSSVFPSGHEDDEDDDDASSPLVSLSDEADIIHTVGFFKSLQHLHLNNLSEVESRVVENVKDFLDALTWLLEELRTEFCSACVIILSISKELESLFFSASQALYDFSFKISFLLPFNMRKTLLFPAILFPTSEENALDLLRLGCSTGVVQAVMTPLPLKPADHIYREIREKGTLKYLTHHGIYMGNGRVINFTGNEISLQGLLFNSSRAKIKVTSIIHFLIRGSRLKIQRYSQCDPDDVVLLRAEKALVDQQFPKYNMFKNNCEHFCYYCKTGEFRSKQVENGIKYAVMTSAVLTATLCLGVTAALKKK